MKKVLIVSPRFPPTNAPDLHRVRLSLKYFSEFSWQPIVLSVDANQIEQSRDPLLLDSIPRDILIKSVGALPLRGSRKLGLGDLGIRSWPFLYTAGVKLIRRHKIDLVYFSTTAFVAMTLGRAWKIKTGVPFVLDMQDPWLSDYYINKPKNERPRKYWFSSRLHRVLEPWTMKEVDGLIAVSEDYIRKLRDRYPRLINIPSLTLPFAASEHDFEIVKANPQPNRYFTKGAGNINGVYVGRGGADMRKALEIIFGALQRGLFERPSLYKKIKLHFVGTDYARKELARKTIFPIAKSYGVDHLVAEDPERIPYFQGLQLLEDADFLIVPGSDDPQYTASKIYPYIMARKPLLAVFHEHSSVCQLLRRTNAGNVLAFNKDHTIAEVVGKLQPIMSEMLSNLPYIPKTNWEAFEPFTAREMTRKQCELFDQCLVAYGGQGHV